MNRKEAIEQLENLLGHCESMANRDSHVWDADCQALKLAIAALRPVSREQGYDCRRTAQYCGEHFVPWEERYGQE